jgi:uncharacterized damage-inducible protein DinB
MTQHELLDRLEVEIRELLRQVRTQLVPLPDSLLLAHPVAGQWNIPECLAHLNAYTDFYLPKIELAIHKAKARKWASDTELSSAWAGQRAIQRVDPDNTGKKRKAPKKFNFAGKPVGREEIKHFIISAEKLLRHVQLCREINLNKPTVPMAHTRLFSFKLGDLLQYLVAHARRHIAQACQAVDGSPV